eukprot:jgi/Tetstr1/463708/TSEL_008567.t1
MAGGGRKKRVKRQYNFGRGLLRSPRKVLRGKNRKLREKLKDIEAHSGRLVLQLGAEDSKWRKLYMSMRRRHHRLRDGGVFSAESDGDVSEDEEGAEQIREAEEQHEAAAHRLRAFAEVVAEAVASEVEADAELVHNENEEGGDDDELMAPSQAKEHPLPR